MSSPNDLAASIIGVQEKVATVQQEIDKFPETDKAVGEMKDRIRQLEAEVNHLRRSVVVANTAQNQGDAPTVQERKKPKKPKKSRRRVEFANLSGPVLDNQEKKLLQWFTMRSLENCKKNARPASDLFAELQHWLSQLLNVNFTGSEDMFSKLQGGDLLLNMLKKIDSNLICLKLPGIENLTSEAKLKIFFSACKEFGIPQCELFDPDLLTDRSNDLEVINSLLSVSRVAAERYKIEPPPCIKQEMTKIATPRQSLVANMNLHAMSAATVQKANYKPYIADNKDEIDLGIAKFVNDQLIPEEVRPKRIGPHQYIFGNDTKPYELGLVRKAPVVNLSRHSWEDLGLFLDKRMGVLMERSLVTIPEECSSAASTISGKGSPSMHGRPPVVDNGEITAGRRLSDIDVDSLEVHKIFFFLTTLSTKLKHTALQYGADVSVSAMFDKAHAMNIPFYHYYSFIKQELSKKIIETHYTDAKSSPHRSPHPTLRDARKELMKSSWHNLSFDLNK